MGRIIYKRKFLRFILLVVSALIMILAIIINATATSINDVKENLIEGEVCIDKSDHSETVTNIYNVHIYLPSSSKTDLQNSQLEESLEQTSVNNTIITISEKEIDMLVQAVQHEVGNNPYYFPGYNFDYIQQCMAKVIINRVGKQGFANSVTDVLSQPGHFMPLENLSDFDPNDETTRQNVLSVLYGTDNIPDSLVFEMSFTSLDVNHNIEIMEQQVGDVIPFYSALTADNRYLLFAMQA